MLCAVCPPPPPRFPIRPRDRPFLGDVVAVVEADVTQLGTPGGDVAHLLRLDREAGHVEPRQFGAALR